MATTAFIYGLMLNSTFNKEADWDTDAPKCMLTTVTYVPNQDTHQYKSSVTNEVVGTGYTATGVALTSNVFTYTAGTNVFAFDAIDASWPGSTFTTRIGVVYDSTPGTDATRPLASYVDMGGDQTVSSATFAIQWASGGIFTITVS